MYICRRLFVGAVDKLIFRGGGQAVCHSEGLFTLCEIHLPSFVSVWQSCKDLIPV